MQKMWVQSLDWESLVAEMVKNPPAIWETWVQSLGWEDRLEKEMAIHSSIIAWKIPWTEEPGRLQSMGLQRVGHDWATSLLFKMIGEFFCRVGPRPVILNIPSVRTYLKILMITTVHLWFSLSRKKPTNIVVSPSPSGIVSWISEDTKNCRCSNPLYKMM